GLRPCKGWFRQRGATPLVTARGHEGTTPPGRQRGAGRAGGGRWWPVPARGRGALPLAEATGPFRAARPTTASLVKGAAHALLGPGGWGPPSGPGAGRPGPEGGPQPPKSV